MAPGWSQNFISPVFEGQVLNAKESSFYEKSDSSAIIFSFPTETLLHYIQASTSQEIPFSINIGTFTAEISLFGNTVEHSNLHQSLFSQSVSRKGAVHQDPESKVTLLVSSTSFYASIITGGKRFVISNAERGGKIRSNVFSLVEQPDFYSTKNHQIHGAENQCNYVSVDMGVQIDQSFSDHFDNVDDAMFWAANCIGNDASQIWETIDNRIVINVVWSEGPYADDHLFNSDISAWASNIRNDWSSSRPCIRKDGVVYFTGHGLGVRGFNNTGLYHLCENDKIGYGVAVIGGIDNSWNGDRAALTAAHEIAHQWGLGHEDVVCDEPCNEVSKLLMCSSYGDAPQLSFCMRQILNSKFSSPHCECLEEYIPPYGSEDCPRCYAKVTNISTDNPHPIKDCAIKSDIMTISVIIQGGCNAVNEPIRAKFRQDLAQVEVDQDGRFSNYFTHQRILLNSNPPNIELIARENPTGPNDDVLNPELIAHFPNLEAQKSLSIKLKYMPGSSLPQQTHFISVYMKNNVDQIGIGEVQINPYFSKTIQAGQTVLDVIDPQTNARFFQINGDLDFPIVLTFDPQNSPTYLYEIPIPGSSNGITGYDFTGYHLIMGVGNKIHLNGDTKLKLINGEAEACTTMWTGIELEEGASIECVSSALKDAQFGIRLKGTAIADVRQTTFENDNYGFHAIVPATSLPPIITLSGNKFINTAALKSSYSGQSPLPFGGKGYAGVYVDRVPSLNISSAGGANSSFKNLHNGIITYNSNLKISHTFFEDILKVQGAPSLPGTLLSPGKAVYAQNGSLVVTGEGILLASPASFTNCNTAIQGQNASLMVSNNKMLSVNNGVISNVAINKNVIISDNDILAKDKGIAVSHQLALPNGCSIGNNVVRLVGNADGVGIQTGGSDNFPQQEGSIFLNTVLVTNGAAGIEVGPSRNLKVTRNTVTLNNGSSHFGIGIAGGDLNTINCNTISGTGEKGIYGMMAGRSNFVCNTATGTGLGLHFEGVFVGKGNIRVAGNTLDNNAGGGLLMGADAVIGEQLHQGNKWTGAGFTIAQHLGAGNIPLKSKFIVDANQNTAFLPNVILPGQWFDNVQTQSTSFQCIPGGLDCPLIPFGSDPVREKEIANGQLTGLAHQSAQLWTAQHRLYERLSEEGNPYPGDPDFYYFMAQSQTNGLKAYADIQLGIRQLFQVSATDRSDLSTYETQITQGLDQLTQIEAQLNTTGLSQQDSITYSNQRNAIKQNLFSLNMQRENKLTNIANARVSVANTLYSQNSGLSGIGTYQANEKVVNGIFLETVAAGNSSFSSTQLASLQAIATQCPLSGGEAVLRARDMLALTQVTPIFYNDGLTCGSSSARPSQDRISGGRIEDFIQIRPNPASESVSIKYALSNGMTHHILIISVFGQVMGDYLLNDKEGEITINIENFPVGVYWYTVTGSISGSTFGKLIINR